MSEFEIVKVLYARDLATKESLNTKVTIQITVETVLVGALVYYIQVIPKLPNKLWVGIYIVLLFVYILACIVSIGYTLIIYIGKSYKYITTDIVEEVYSNFRKYYDDNFVKFFSSSNYTKEELISLDSTKQIIDIMNKCSLWNIQRNREKSNGIRFNAILIGISLAMAFVLEIILTFFN